MKPDDIERFSIDQLERMTGHEILAEFGSVDAVVHHLTELLAAKREREAALTLARSQILETTLAKTRN